MDFLNCKWKSQSQTNEKQNSNIRKLFNENPANILIPEATIEWWKAS